MPSSNMGLRDFSYHPDLGSPTLKIAAGGANVTPPTPWNTPASWKEQPHDQDRGVLSHGPPEPVDCIGRNVT